ncbi:MAG: glycosyltransferase family 4 protein [Bacteroidota bacterium]|nr:glycosyltransferase family 4 protein [Bacteroidota bacterium]
MKKKVIFVGSFKENTKDGSVGGQMFACKTLINSYLKDKIEFILIDTTADTVPAPSLPLRSIKAIRRLFVFIRKLITYKVETILLFCSDGFSFIEKGAMALIAKLFGKKVIFAPRSGMSKDDYERSKFMRWYMKFVLNKVDYIICQGNSWKDFYKEVTKRKLPESKFIVQQNWIDTDEYVKNHNGYVIRRCLILKVLYLGWIEEYKGIFDIINAIHKLKERGFEIELQVYGSGSKINEATQLVEKLKLDKVIYFKGWADQKKKLQAFIETDIYILPSHREGFPNSLLEAMASGLPVIATDVGGITDLVKNGYNGLLVQHSNVEELAEALSILLKNPEMRSNLAFNARESVMNHNSIEIACKTFDGIF